MRLASLNAFRFCKFLEVLGHIMIVVVLGLIGVQYYSVVVLALGPGMSSEDTLKAVVTGLLAGLYTILVFLILWSYFTTVLTNPGIVPADWHPFLNEAVEEVELQRWMQYGDVFYDRRDPQRPRYCRKCCVWKPERTHHCSVSQRCILKMDHYCIWVVNCIGLLNYKFFLLFLVYTCIGSSVSMIIQIPSLIDYFSDDKPDGSTTLFVAFVLNVAFTVTLAAFLSMHLKLLSMNCTSIEMYEKQRINPWPYDNGAWKNIQDVFGECFWIAFLPYHTENEKQRLLDSVLTPRLMSCTSSLDNVV